MDKRKSIEIALKEIMVSEFRKEGFKGTFPHFLRKDENETNKISFQFDKYGGRFIIELYKFTSDEDSSRTNLDFGDRRMRINPENDKLGEFWFDFGKLEKDEDFSKLAKEALVMYQQNSANWW